MTPDDAKTFIRAATASSNLVKNKSMMGKFPKLVQLTVGVKEKVELKV